ncbi:hypothetical protein CONPUDRAFT_146280 [Coniophora puteana RWD-64-598 SS2]|uniref:Uncharacterized protein n=1 Tax=Coniophora puteana (strain RWD-64-598) TaxID=741705 RepID=A0A5M3MDC6_CONPW|nr:uncharacterized protein CONPUDRAFT_146280 [Coniophora puteana RWD-64-598 SS2]EIW77249.1 hypothetical protein CONPUDRAFT_146280 [Coniophora puteana RWD-64-598 SS2]
MFTTTLKSTKHTCILAVCIFLTVAHLFASAAFSILHRLLFSSNTSSTYLAKSRKSTHRDFEATRPKQTKPTPTPSAEDANHSTPKLKSQSDISREIQEVKARALSQRNLLQRLMTGDSVSPGAHSCIDSGDNSDEELALSSTASARPRNKFNHDLQDIKARALAQQSLLRGLMAGDDSAMERLRDLRPRADTRAYTHRISTAFPRLRLVFSDGKETEDQRLIYAVGSRPLGASAPATEGQNR